MEQVDLMELDALAGQLGDATKGFLGGVHQIINDDYLVLARP